jgi:iron-sulfur cluster assembly protein
MNANTSTRNEPTIALSDSAVREVKKIMESEGLDPRETFVRVGVKGGGCSGLTYVLDYEGEKKEGDRVFEKDGVSLVCDPKSFMFLQGTVLDFSGGLNGKGFVFLNPNAKGTCGCGESFKV